MLPVMFLVHGSVQHYAWGDSEAIPRVLGVPADGRPWAEWWIGTHTEAPSTLVSGNPLSDVAGELPYLLKLLAAAQPLSLQTHPNRWQAETGFDREEAASVALSAPDRVYRDRNPKPELLCAVTPFDALCGFRPPAETAALLRSLGAPLLAATLEADGLTAAVQGLYRSEINPSAAIDACRNDARPEAALVTELAAQYPGDPSVAVTLFLNRITLQPGEAVYLTAGNLHAYVHGLGVEIMEASDNVVRGGLTPKHVDVEELLRVLDYTPLLDPVVRPVELLPGRWYYSTPGAPFDFWRFEVDGDLAHTATTRELLLCTAGSAGVIRQGQSMYLEAGEAIRLHGTATVFRVGEVGLDNG
jgi:mannose-6-phosphate isomerase